MNKADKNASYNSLSEAMNALRQQGYTEDFNLKSHCLHCVSSNIQLNPEDFEVDAYYRFEGMSNPDDNSIIYAISSNAGMKGILVDAYGIYSDSLNEAMIKKLRVNQG